VGVLQEIRASFMNKMISEFHPHRLHRLPALKQSA
jgi:hypothetical protein